MKATPHSYRLVLSQVDKAVLSLGIRTAIEKGKFSVNDPVRMSKALDLLGHMESVMFIITGWDAKYILIPALDTVPVNMIEDEMYTCLRGIADRKF